jgi:hypothetical protein
MNEYIKGLTVIINTIWNYKLFFDTNLSEFVPHWKRGVFHTTLCDKVCQ